MEALTTPCEGKGCDHHSIYHGDHNRSQHTSYHYMHDANCIRPQRFDTVSRTPDVDNLLSIQQRQLDLQCGLAFRKSDANNVWRERSVIGLAAGIEPVPQSSLDYSKQHYGNSSNSEMTRRSASNRRSCFRSHSDSLGLTKDFTDASASTTSTMATLINNYVLACQRPRPKLDQRRSANTGPYRCTFGCDYRTGRNSDWRRHEESHEPQALWLCELCCQIDPLRPFLVNRKDKFLSHVKARHNGYRPEEVLVTSRVPFAPKIAECPYCYAGLTPKNWSWDERCKHVLQHFGYQAKQPAESYVK
jgi:hypothetical protein